MKMNEEWVKIALDLTSGISNQDRFERLLTGIRKVLKCDASALLSFHNQCFTPLAINGLYHEVLGRRFNIDQHPRLEAIARAGDIVRFPSDSDLPDPYDGLIPSLSDQLEVHSCIGLPLVFDDRLIGAVTIDAFDPEQFDRLSNHDLRMVSALAAASLNTALLMEQLENQMGYLPEPNTFQPHASPGSEMIGHSPAMLELKEHISAVANTDLSVLIMGETGVGKELVASAIHAQSFRSNQNLVYLNCAALPESVAESELFGHVKGAFTGAISNRQGKFELANHGTLFLDEVGELSLTLQAKLLRALQYGDVQRVGDDKPIKVNTRIVAATNRIMHEEVKAGRFRSDLYHRLSVFPIFVPPLRERGNDLVLLTGFFAERSRTKLAVDSIAIAPETIELLSRCPWEGNVRELEHTIKRAAVIARAQSPAKQLVLLPEHFDLTTQAPATGQEAAASPLITTPSSQLGHFQPNTPNLKLAIDQFQTQFIRQAFEQNEQNWAATARQLHLDPGNLHRLAKRLGLK